jgi:hypothetical protein
MAFTRMKRVTAQWYEHRRSFHRRLQPAWRMPATRQPEADGSGVTIFSFETIAVGRQYQHRPGPTVHRDRHNTNGAADAIWPRLAWCAV